jgi:Leucine-rich repeat (LRR) protein
LENVSTSLPKLSQLEELYAAGNYFSNTEKFPTLYPMLEVLDVRQNKLPSADSLKPLGKLGSLNELQLESNPVCSQCEK